MATITIFIDTQTMTEEDLLSEESETMQEEDNNDDK